MPELREVFEMTTKQMGEPDLDSWRVQQERQRKANRNKKIGAFAVAAAIGVAAIAVIIGTGGSGDSTAPANRPGVNPGGPTAQEVARGFFEAYSAYDADRAITYLADNADLSGLFGLEGTRDFRLLISFWEATGFKHILDSCEAGISLPSATVFRCTYDFHGLRSDEIGRGPYSGSYDDITVRDGEIVDVWTYFDISKFSTQMWDPFASWIVTNYPEDEAVMYEPTLSGPQLTRESIRLWEQHTREYVKAVQQGTA